MPAFDPAQLAADAGGTWHPGPPATPLTGFAIDSRTVGTGDVFVALRTERRDGHEFVSDAATRGAGAALVAGVVADCPLPQLVVPDTLRAFHALARAHRARFSGAVIGVTGSAGKTSTKDLLAALLDDHGSAVATEGNLNNHLGVPLTLLRLDSARHRRAVIEAGISAPGEMDMLAELLAPDIAIVTTVAPAHLDGLGSVDGVAREKARLAAHRRAGGLAVFPAECLRHPAFAELSSPRLVLLPAGAEVPNPARETTLVPFVVRHQGVITRLCLTWHGEVEEFDLRRVTTGMGGNAALAIAVALHLGETVEVLRRRLPLWRPAAMRGEVRRERERMVYLDCYNANPSSMADAVEAFVSLAPAAAPRLFVVGCMEELGTASAELHRTTGEHWPLRGEDRVIIFGQQAVAFAEGMRTRTSDASILVNPPRAEAARIVRDFRGPVFLKGSRRYELETLLDAATPAPVHPDREVAA